MPKAGPDRTVLADLAMSLPGVTESMTHRGWSFRVRGKLLACQAIHPSAEPGSAVVRIGVGERARLLADRPDAYYVTDHYLPYSAVLVRLARVDRASLRAVVQGAHQFVIGDSGMWAKKPRAPARPKRR